jgi:hypothetical protein
MTNEYEYLRPYIGKIVLVTARDSKFASKWQKERESHLITESDIEILPHTQQNLREILPNEIIIEFDLPDKSTPKHIYQPESQKWVDAICTYLEQQNISYTRTSHNGKSDHIRMYIEGLELLPPRVIREYKRELTQQILNDVKFKSKIIEPDWSFCVANNRLVPLEHKPHWKAEHEGAVERIVKKFIGKSPKINETITTRIDVQTLDNLGADYRDISELKEFESSEEKLSQWLSTYLTGGRRNDCMMALSGYCHRLGMSEQDFILIIERCLTRIGQASYIDEVRNSAPYTFSKSRKEVAVKQYLQHIAEDYPKIFTELKSCFVSKTEEQKERIKFMLSSSLKNNTDELSRQFGAELSKIPNVFYREMTDQLVEVNLIQNPEDATRNISKLNITIIDDCRLKNILQRHYEFYTLSKHYDELAVEMPIQTARLLLKNSVFVQKFKKLDKIMNRPYLFETENGLQKEYKGHSEFTHNYYTPDTPVLQEVAPNVARAELLKILNGFCFQNTEDKEMAIAYLLTPALRGLYSNKRKRTPCFAMIANRERAGKDYLAGVRSLIYSGAVIDNPPIADGERSNVDEWRKKFASILLKGETLFHSANNVGYLNNPVFEMLITSEYFEDRLLGSNTQKQIDNYLDISFSANVGLRWRGDMSGRMRRIYLFYEEEDPNSREFPIPDLHNYIFKNRGYIISCIYSLIESWYTAGKPCQDGKVFTSFREWAVLCGSIMDFHNLGNPLVYQEDDELSGNNEELMMRTMFLFMLRWQQNNNKWDVTTSDIIQAIQAYQQDAQNQFGYEDVVVDDMMLISLGTSAEKNNYGRLCKKYRGRVLNGIKFAIVDKNKESKRWRYTFQPVVNK